MIETDAVGPGKGRVTLLTLSGESRCKMIHELRLGVVFAVTRITIGRLTRKRTPDVVLMATLTRKLLVRSTHWEAGSSMYVEPGHKCEMRGVVTLAAVRWQSPTMHVYMAGRAHTFGQLWRAEVEI